MRNRFARRRLRLFGLPPKVPIAELDLLRYEVKSFLPMRQRVPPSRAARGGRTVGGEAFISGAWRTISSKW
jgi:hypothetical protein